MLPIYTATAIKDFAIEGGTSQPCIMSVRDDDGNFLPDDYVVKIYKQNNRVKTYYEVFGSILAKEFDLQTPSPALVHIPYVLIKEIINHEKYKNWDLVEGVYFACVYLPNAKSFDQNSRLNLTQMWQYESIFAFDVLIRNFDRRTQKPNLLRFSDDLFVIDHEMAFASILSQSNFEVYLTLENWKFIVNANGGGHVLRNHLMKFNKKNKLDFATFLENFRTLQPEILYNNVNQLIEKDVELLDIQPIIAYLRHIKQNTAAFKSLLENLLIN
jgi:hypothetical protein